LQRFEMEGGRSVMIFIAVVLVSIAAFAIAGFIASERL
jgi:hypothetical protein